MAEENRILKITRVPDSLRKELWKAAAAAQVSVRRAVIVLLEDIGPDLGPTVRAGLKRAGGFEGERVRPLSVQVPVRLKAALDAASKASYYEIGKLGRYALMARAGRLSAAVSAGLRERLARAS